MHFFDCNCYLGLPMNGALRPVATAEALLGELDRSGIDKALVWHIAQHDWAVPEGNRMLTDAIAGHHDRLIGCWTLLPEQTGEIPSPAELPREMAAANIRALRVFPNRNNYLLREEVMGSYLEIMVLRRIPLILTINSIGWEAAYDILRAFPELVCIIEKIGSWGADRWFRPLLERYDHCYVEISEYLLDGGIQDVVERYGASRLLYGSGFPVYDHGGMMLALHHAEIGEEEKQAIAAGNLEHMLREVLIAPEVTA